MEVWKYSLFPKRYHAETAYQSGEHLLCIATKTVFYAHEKQLVTTTATTGKIMTHFS
jgi:hypothetical protein